MSKNTVFRSVLISAGVLLIAACASQPAPKGALMERKFQQTAQHYLKYQNEGQVVYCKPGATKSLPPSDCITETALRLQVENYEKSRNPVPRGGPPYVSTVPGGSGSGT